MFRKILLAVIALASMLAAQDRESKSSRIDVDNYAIDAEINPRTQALTANVKVRFIPLDNDLSSASFELTTPSLSRAGGRFRAQIPASRSGQDFSVRLSFPAPLAKGKPATVTFSYDGRLTGQEESPIYGIKFGAIQNDFAYLMYPCALVSGERLLGGSFHVRSSHHGTQRVQGDRKRLKQSPGGISWRRRG